MKVTTGRVVGGKIVLDDGTLIEGQTVTVLAPEPGEGFELDEAATQALLASMRQLDEGQFVDGDELLEKLRRS
jgi:hypothetical protein